MSESLQDDKDRFLKLCTQIKRPGIDELTKWLETGGDFFTAPASHRYHGAFRGGLLKHSLNVYDELHRLLPVYEGLIHSTEETNTIITLFHDLCKINFYGVEKRNRKNEQGKWESYDAYTVDEKYCFGGHGSKSVFLVQHFIQLTPEEAAAINSHMSCWDGNLNVGHTYEQFPLAWLLHVADESATYCLETKENN